MPKSKKDIQSYILLLLPDPNPTSYLVFFYTRPDIEKPYPYGTGIELLFLKNLVITHDRYLSHHLYGAAQNDLKALVVANHVFNFEGLLSHLWVTIIGQSDKHKLSAFLSSS